MPTPILMPGAVLIPPSAPEAKAQHAQDMFTQKVTLYGSTVFQENGTPLLDAAGLPLKAFQDQDVKAIIGGLTGEDAASAKPPLALFFGAAAVGIVQENMRVSLGPPGARRDYRLGSPLHPQQVADVLVYLAAVAYPW